MWTHIKCFSSRVWSCVCKVVVELAQHHLKVSFWGWILVWSSNIKFNQNLLADDLKSLQCARFEVSQSKLSGNQYWI